MKNIFIIISISSVIFWGCHRASQNDPHAGHDHAEHESHDHGDHDHDLDIESEDSHAHAVEAGDDVIRFPAAQAALTDFSVETVVSAPFRSVIACTGEISPAQGDMATVSATASGIVSFADTSFSEGAAVAAHRALFYISSAGLADGDSFEMVRAGYERAKNEIERLEMLKEDNIVSAREYDAAMMEYRQSKIKYDALAGTHSSRGTAVNSTTGGYVSQLYVSQGGYVEVGQPLMTISRNKRLSLRADVPQRYNESLRGALGAHFLSPGSDKVFALDKMGGRLVAIGMPSAANAYMIPVTFDFDASPGVIPGSLVEVFIMGAVRGEAVTVPVGAIVESQGTNYVYVQLCREEFVRREVVCGQSDGGRIEIISGLKAGERVVVKGAMQVKMASASGAIPHGHTH